MTLICRICRKIKEGRRFFYVDDPLDCGKDSKTNIKSGTSIAGFINQSITGINFRSNKNQHNKICEVCFKKLQAVYKFFKIIKESDIIFQYSAKSTYSSSNLEEDHYSDCVIICEKRPPILKSIIRLSSNNYLLNHKQLKIEHRTKDIKMVILTDEDEKRLLTLPLPTRDLTVSDILEAGNIAFSSSDYMHCEDCHLEEDFNFIVVMLPEGCDRAYAEYKIEKFKKNHKKVGDTNCKYCFLLKNEGVKCGNCTIKTNDPCASNERLMILSEIVNKFSVKSEKKEKKTVIGSYRAEKKRQR